MEKVCPALETIKKLSTKKNLALARMARIDFLATIAYASLCIPVSVKLSEPEVNTALKQWLSVEGSMLRVDHVELRRTLIDLRLWSRDSFGKVYQRCSEIADAEMATYIAELTSCNVAEIVRHARAQADAEREQRKARAIRNKG
jgi:hypothetical protein